MSNDIIIYSKFRIQLINSLTLCIISQLQDNIIQAKKLYKTENINSETYKQLENYERMIIPDNKLDELFENAKKHLDLFMREKNRILILELFKKHIPDMIKDGILKIIKSKEYPEINEFVVLKATFEKNYHLQNIKPRDEANIKSNDKANIKLKDEANSKPKDKANIKLKDEANIKPKDEVNINKKLEMPNNTKRNAELVAKENKKVINNQNDFSKANNSITGKENPIIDNKRYRLTNEISNPKKYFHSEINEAADTKINIEDKVIFERPKPRIVEKIERIERVKKSINSAFPEYKPNMLCECGKSNEDSWEVCPKCNLKLKPGIFGWICKFCTFRNDDERAYCSYSCFNYRGVNNTILEDNWK